MLALTYVVPLATATAAEPLGDLPEHLEGLARHVDQVLVVDGSPPEAVAAHRRLLAPSVDLVPTRHRTPMGKVGNVITGVEDARHESVVIADDDVRYRPDQLADVADRLRHADVVRPQNHFRPLPWHARVDTARTLLARLGDGDWPGTLAVRRSSFLAAGCYAGDVLFENLELVRTIVAAGGREDLVLGLLVERRPPTTGHFMRQQVRQAYDELARPPRLLASLAVGPAVAASYLLPSRRRWMGGAALAVGAGLAAEAGRRRAGGAAAYPATSSLLAGPWLVWRSLCSWVALGAWVRGGARYRGGRLRRAATPLRRLRRRPGAGVSPAA